jgi:hypothetical protein
MAFTYDLTTDVGKLRLAVGDSIENSGPRPQTGASSNFSDEELQHFVTTEGTVGSASAAVFETLAAEWSIFTNITLGPRKEEFAKIAEAFLKRAAAARARYGGGLSFSVSWSRVDGYSEASEGSTGL